MSEDLPEDQDVQTFDKPDSELPPLPITDDDDEAEEDSLPREPNTVADDQLEGDESAMSEGEMKRKLMDIESSFMPDLSTGDAVQSTANGSGADDTFLFGITSKDANSQMDKKEESYDDRALANDYEPASPLTPRDAYMTPAVSGNPFDFVVGGDKSRTTPAVDAETPSTGDIQSSPTAAAAERNSLRAAGLSNGDGLFSKQTAIQNTPDSPSDVDTNGDLQKPKSRASTIRGEEDADGEKTPKPDARDLEAEKENTASDGSRATSKRLTKRPSFLKSRFASQRSSASSITNRSDLSLDVPSDGTIGADYALQSGGALPASGGENGTLRSLPRLPSLSSVASSMSSAGGDFINNGSRLTGKSSGLLNHHRNNNKSLEPLNEEDRGESGSLPPATPRPGTTDSTAAPTDTVIAQHVQNIRVPDTVVKAYREKHPSSSPDRRNRTLSFSSKGRSTLTLKEQNNKLDKLSKENFDLKLKIHFLDQALQTRSDEGIKEMISKNVQLQTDLVNEKKENQGLRRQMRDLERRLRASEDGEKAATARPASSGSDGALSSRSAREADLEEEILYLRGCLEQSETQIDELRENSATKEMEKRRLSEYVKTMGDKKPSEPNYGFEESIEMWKDLLEAETARREQADEDAQKLREDVRRLKREASTHGSSNGVLVGNRQADGKRGYVNPRSHSGASDITSEHNGAYSSTGATLVEQLRHENAELRRDLGAQTSMLVSRNRERERLQQEIEDLKIHHRRGDGGRSIAGESIFERSVSRAHQRSTSRTSGATRMTQLSDAEREDVDRKHAALRDELAEVKLVNQDLERELNAHLDALTQVETENESLKEDRTLAVDDLQALQTERDEVLLALQEKEADFESLREEAVAAIDKLESEIEQKEQELDRLASDLETRNEDFHALQGEMKTVSESLVKLEDDQQANLRKIVKQEQELDDANRELEAFDKRIRESNVKIERLEVQLESNQGEIGFLREEQEGDKIKIGELEASLSAALSTLQDEKERYKDLDDRLQEERRQREILDSQEKQEVQKVLNELNSQATKAKDEVKKLRKNLSQTEVESESWKEQFEELEGGLREMLGDPNGTKTSLLRDINKLQKDLDDTIHDLEQTRNELAEKDRILRTRDALLESTGLEAHKLSEMLDKERQARKQDRHHFEQAQRGHQSVTRTVQHHESRVAELESARGQDRRKMAHLEQQFRNQLAERNNLLLAIWNRLSTLCGADWSQRNSLVNGEVPSVDVIGRNISGFSRNIISAVKMVEGLMGSFRSRIRNVEKDLWKDFQTLEHNLDVRSRTLEQLERTVHGRIRAASHSSSYSEPEIARLKGENKRLRAELQYRGITTSAGSPSRGSSIMATPSEYHYPNHYHRQQLQDFGPQGSSPSPSSSTRKRTSGSSGGGGGGGGAGGGGFANMTASLLRHHSTSAVEALRQAAAGQRPLPQSQSIAPPLSGPMSAMAAPTMSSTSNNHQQTHSLQQQQQQQEQPSEKRWIYRLKELERRLKAEREARLLDRSGARKRLEERSAENQELKAMLAKEKERRGSMTGSASVDGAGSIAGAGSGNRNGMGTGTERVGDA